MAGVRAGAPLAPPAVPPLAPQAASIVPPASVAPPSRALRVRVTIAAPSVAPPAPPGDALVIAPVCTLLPATARLRPPPAGPRPDARLRQRSVGRRTFVPLVTPQRPPCPPLPPSNSSVAKRMVAPEMRLCQASGVSAGGRSTRRRPRHAPARRRTQEAPPPPEAPGEHPYRGRRETPARGCRGRRPLPVGDKTKTIPSRREGAGGGRPPHNRSRCPRTNSTTRWEWLSWSCTVIPPSTTRAWPVTNVASSDAR